MGKNIYIDLFNRGKEYWTGGNDSLRVNSNVANQESPEPRPGINYNVKDRQALQALLPSIKPVEFPFEVERNPDGSFKSIPETSAEVLHSFSKKHPPLEDEKFGEYWDRLGTQGENVEEYYTRVEETLGYDLFTQEGSDALANDEKIKKIRKEMEEEIRAENDKGLIKKAGF